MVVDMTEHEVVLAGAEIRIPLFGEGSHSLLELCAIAWRILVVEHLIEQVASAVLYQHLEEVVGADVACGETIALNMNAAVELLEELWATAFGIETEIEINGEGGLGSTAKTPTSLPEGEDVLGCLLVDF